MCSNTCVNVIELDYVVLKLNGNDITSLSNCEAVQMFLQAKENLIVELFRKKTPTENTYDVRGIIPSEEVATCGKFKENIEILNKETCASTNINSNSNTAYASQKKSKIVLTLRAIINSDHNVPALDDIDLPPNAQSKETQTIEDYQLHVPDSRHNENIVKTIADHFIEQEHHLFEHCLEPEIDIEEVTLIKKDSSSSEPLGITVCGNDFFKEYDESFKPVITSEDAANEANLEENVFISEIQADSLAEKDGRLRRGDQVLRINGIDIKSKKHAETVFTENGTSVTLLVSRILYPDEEDENDDDDDDEDDEDDDIDSNFVYANRFLTDDYTNVVDKLEKVLLAQQNSMPPANKSQLESKPHPETLANSEGNKSKSITSSISKAQSDSVSNQLAVTRVPPINPPNNKQQYDYDDSEHIYETIPEDSESEPLYCSPYQSSNYITACSSADVLKMQQQTQRVAQWLGIKHQQISSRTAHTLAGRPSVYTKHIQQRLSHRVCTLRSAITSTSRSSSSGAANSACGLNNIDTDINNQNHNLNHNQLHEEVENSSSAYNTGGSNNSASPRQNLNLENDNFTSSIVTTTPKTQSKETFLISPINKVLMLPFGKTSRILYPTSSSALNHIYAQDNNPVQNKVISDAVQPSTASPSAKPESKQMRAKLLEEQQVQCPQFNAPNLSRYHFVSSKEAASKRMSGATSSSVFVNHDNAEEVPMVWKVKRRPDGSRYIVKRPARSHVNQVEIRRNVEKIKQDDDVISDLKLGRYWTKEERRRHIERAREKRQLQHQVQPQQQ